MYTITQVSHKEIIQIIELCKPLGLFYCKHKDGKFTAVDNTDGEPFTNTFDNHRDVYKFLNNK